MLTNPQDCLNHLKENFTKAGSPISYAGINTINKFYNGILSNQQIEDFLTTNFARTLHVEKNKSTVNPTFKYFKRYQWQCDLCEFITVSHLNANWRYLFCCIDIYTR